MIASAGVGAAAVVLGAGGRAGGRVGEALVVGGATILPAALGAVCGAMLSIGSEPSDPLSADVLVAPELVASTRFVLRMVAAPALAMVGTLPVLAARSHTGAGAASAAGATSAAIVVSLSVALFLNWRRREVLR